MQTKKTWANFSVRDLERTTKFYKRLGFKHNGALAELTSFLPGAFFQPTGSSPTNSAVNEEDLS